MEQRRKHFAAKSAKEKEELNHNPKLIQRKIICTYLKNMEGKKPKNLKNESFDSIQKMFDRAFKRVNTFVDFRTDLVEGSSKRAGEELESKRLAIDVVPLATSPPNLCGLEESHRWKEKGYYQISKSDGNWIVSIYQSI
ncbi:hypothetical protein Tco_1176617 [Tanacetum coccineum]